LEKINPTLNKMSFKRLKRETIYECEWVNLYADKVEVEHGEIIERYHQLDFPKKSVAILVINNNKVCLLKSYRYTTQKVGIEIPAGYVESGEELALAAQREVLEETGLQCSKPEFFFKFLPSNGISNQCINVFIAQAEGEPIKHPEHEGIRDALWCPLKEIPDLLETMDDGISMLALSRYLLKYHQ